jgi:hypothetical protein
VGAGHVAALDLPCGKATLGSNADHATAPEPAGGKATPGAATDHVAALDLTSQGGSSRSWHSGVYLVFRL